MAVICDYDDKGLIENSVALIGREDLGNKRIGYALEVRDLHRQGIGREMRVQIDSREIDNLNVRNAMFIDGSEQLRDRILVQVLVHVDFLGRILPTSTRQKLGVQSDHRDR